MPGVHHADPEERRRLRRATDESSRSSPPSAAPLIVGRADDAAEREADRLADEVLTRLRGSASPVRRTPAGQSRPATDAPPEVGYEGGPLSPELSGEIEGARGRGEPLAPGVRERMESAFGTSLASVRVHAGPQAAALTRRISARAFTAGQDIFFGAGEYRPHTADGEQVLAHELVHTQDADAVRRVHRLWDFDAARIDWDRTVRVSTVPTGQGVYFMEDAACDKLVVKVERLEVGLGELAGVLHTSLSRVKSVRHRKLDAADRDEVADLIGDKNKLDPVSWGGLGATKRADGRSSWVDDELRKAGNGSADDIEFAQCFHQYQLQHRPSLVAMTLAEGETAAQLGKPDPRSQRGNSRMRDLMMNEKHMISIGEMTAVDLFFGNGDRAYMGNLGNWFYDPEREMITTIDHVDDIVHDNFTARYQAADEVEKLLKPLKRGELQNTAQRIVKGLATGLSNKNFSGDTKIDEWLDSENGWRRKMMEAAILKGLKAGRERVIKTFTANRYRIGRKKSRAVKKSIKAAAQQAYSIDKDGSADPDEYYKILKMRVQWLKKN